MGQSSYKISSPTQVQLEGPQITLSNVYEHKKGLTYEPALRSLCRAQDTNNDMTDYIININSEKTMLPQIRCAEEVEIKQKHSSQQKIYKQQP